MYKKQLKKMAVVMSCILLFTGCKGETSVVDNNDITITPTSEAAKDPTETPTIEVPETPTALPETTPTTAPKDEIPMKAQISIDYESQGYTIDNKEDQVPIVFVDVEYPVVSIPENQEASKKINDFFVKMYDQIQAQAASYESEASSAYADRGDDSFWESYGITSRFYLQRANECCISFGCMSTYEVGGPHPNNDVLSYTFDTKTGELLKLDDIVEDMTAFKQLFNDKALEFLKDYDQKYASAMYGLDEGESIFYPDYEDVIPDLLQDNTWCFTEEGFNVTASEYTISSHAYGSFDIVIPYDKLEYVKDEYKNPSVVITFKYGDVDITKQLSDEEAKIIQKIVGNKTYILDDEPSCGFNKDIAFTIDGMPYEIACDSCPIIRDGSYQVYYDITDEQRKALEEIFKSYGGYFPCV